MDTPQLNASSRIMYEEATQRGIRCTTFGDKETILMEKDGQQWYTRGSRTTFQSSVGASFANYKGLAKKVLNHFHLPTAKAVEVDTEADLPNIQSLQFPLVMKPRTGTHGDGVIVGIKNYEDAVTAFKNQSTVVLFEEMLKGIEYRIVCVDFKFVAAAFRKPAHVVGDNQHTIQELIDQKNTHPWRGKGHTNNLSLIEVDDLVLSYMKDQGFELSSIPEAGKEVLLRKTANLSTGGEAWDVTDQIIPENRALFEKIAKASDLNTIGIDLMCERLDIPVVDQPQAGVIEVNSSPGLRMHHYPIQGTPRNIAGIILDMVAKNLAARK